jgi:hypothetical protein
MPNMYLPIINEYWQFIAREPSELPLTPGALTVEGFYWKLAVWSTVFSLLYLIVPAASKAFFPSWYNSLTSKKKNDMPSYVTCLLHHLILVPCAGLLFHQDIYRPRDFDYAPISAWTAPISVGYLIGDTLGCAIPELLLQGKVEYLAHHSLTLWLIWTSIFGPGQLLRYIPHLLLCDSSNICFNIAWLLRTTSWKDSSLVLGLELLFALLFLAFRVINLPTLFLALSLNGLGLQLGWARFTFLPISLLQW